MELKEALQKEIDYLDGEIRKSLEYADSKNDMFIGRGYRDDVRRMKSSYLRILKSLSE